MNLSTEQLPTLFSVRGWDAEIGAAYVSFVERMRSTGQTVVDVFTPHEACATFGDWAALAADEILASHDASEPLHLIGYCGGGSLLHLVVRILEDLGVPIDYLGFIDVRAGNPQERLRKGYDSIYQVPWSLRVRYQLARVAPPHSESLWSIGWSVMHRAQRSVRELPRRGWRSSKRRVPAIHHQATLAAQWMNEPITTFAHAYNCPHAIERYWPGDPSLGRAPLLRGGWALRLIDGTHHSCIEPPHDEHLIDLITRDRRNPASGSA